MYILCSSYHLWYTSGIRLGSWSFLSLHISHSFICLRTRRSSTNSTLMILSFTFPFLRPAFILTLPNSKLVFPHFRRDSFITVFHWTRTTLRLFALALQVGSRLWVIIPQFRSWTLPVVLSDRIRLLGITLDSSLNFDHHTWNVCSSSYCDIRSLRRIRHI